MRVLAALSGGVDSSVAAALLLADGHEVVGATMKLWGGPSDAGCCSVGDVDDARAVCRQLGIEHHVFNFAEDFDRHVVEPYVAAHATGRTPNPCVACNRHLKFDRFAVRAAQLGFDAMATGHHAAVVADGPAGPWQLRRGADAAKDQSYVLHMLGQAELARLLLPVGALTKAEVRATAARLGLRTAGKPDSQDTCFIPRDGGRRAFLGPRIPLRPGRVIDADGAQVGSVDAVELVTVGQRRGLGPLRAAAPGTRRYVVDVDLDSATVRLGGEDELEVRTVPLDAVTWTDAEPDPGEELALQLSAHGATTPARWDGAEQAVRALVPLRRPAPGQSAVLYRGDTVVGGGLVAAPGTVSTPG